MNKVRFTRILVLLNPVSTQVAQARGRIKELEQLHPRHGVQIIETSADGRQATIEQIVRRGKILGGQTLLCVAAGDGTVNLVVETLVCNEKLSPTVRQTPLLPLWGGNANDIGHMLNGSPTQIRLADLVRYGSVVPIYPLRCELTYPDGAHRTHVAVGYAGFGATAFAAQRLNASSHRQSVWHRIPGGRIPYELLTVLRAFAQAPTFRIKEHGRVHTVYERIFLNGPRMAKLHPLKLRLTDKGFYQTMVEEKRLRAVLARIRDLLRHPAVQKASKEATFTCLGQAWAQFDGESIRIPAGTQVRIRRSEVPFYALSNRLGSHERT